MSKASLIHHYEDPQDAVTAPHKFMSLTHYYVDKWLPELGERGNIIVTVLRRMGYLDRERDVERGGIEIEQEDMAVLCGLKLRTLQREFGNDEQGQPVNPVLHRFVQREKQYYRNGSGRIVREKTVYIVQMKDPLHPSDLAALEEERERREKNQQKSRSRQLGGYGNDHPRSRQVGGEERQDGGRSRQDDMPARQLGGNNIVNSDSYLPEKTPDTLAACQDLPSASSELGLRIWSDLAEAEQKPYRDQAAEELRKYAIEAGPERWARIGPRQEEVRAKNIYERAQK